MRNEKGFTLIELLVTMGLVAVLLTLSAGTLRNYWFNQSLKSAAGEVVDQFRRIQARSTSESHPLVYGARFRLGSSDWDVVKHEPDGTCVRVESHAFDSGGVRVSPDPAASGFASSNETSNCMAGFATAGGTPIPTTSDDMFVLFYARGSATAGSLTVEQPTIARSRTISVGAVTGRVESS